MRRRERSAYSDMSTVDCAVAVLLVPGCKLYLRCASRRACSYWSCALCEALDDSIAFSLIECAEITAPLYFVLRAVAADAYAADHTWGATGARRPRDDASGAAAAPSRVAVSVWALDLRWSLVSRRFPPQARVRHVDIRLHGLPDTAFAPGTPRCAPANTLSREPQDDCDVPGLFAAAESMYGGDDDRVAAAVPCKTDRDVLGDRDFATITERALRDLVSRGAYLATGEEPAASDAQRAPRNACSHTVFRRVAGERDVVALDTAPAAVGVRTLTFAAPHRPPAVVRVPNGTVTSRWIDTYFFGPGTEFEPVSHSITAAAAAPSSRRERSDC